MVKYDTTESILAKVESERIKFWKSFAKEKARRDFEQAKRLAEEEREQTKTWNR